MYIHLGNDTVVRDRAVIGIFDLDNSSYSRITREFLNGAERAGETRYVADDLPKAFVVTDEGVYLTQLGSQTLSKRAAEEDLI